MARRLLHFSVMLSILILFVMAALGFAIVLKKDAPEQAAPKNRPTKPSQTSRRHSMKPALDEKAVGHIAVNERQQSVVR
jgi:biopolymer transport protein ExbD